MQTKVIDQSKTSTLVESYEMIFLWLLAAVIPFVFEKPQLLVGSIVNAIIAVSFWKSKKSIYAIPVLFLPSLAALSRSVVFGPFTLYLVYLLPFIWAGNSVYGLVIRRLHVRLQFFPATVIASALKAGLLVLATIIMVHYSLLPKIFITNMGIGQFVTAIIGGSIGYLIINLFSHYEKN